MAYGESGGQAIVRILRRLSGSNRGTRLARLSTTTICSVATGVIGIALIQALILDAGFIWADVPAASVWALVVLLLGIAQLLVMVVTLPMIGCV